MRSSTNKRKYKTFNDLNFIGNKAVMNIGEYTINALKQEINPKFIIKVFKNGVDEGMFHFSLPQNVTSLLKLVQNNVMINE